MPLTLTYDNSGYAKGEEVALKGLGVVENGSPVELTEGQELDFLAEYGHTIKEHSEGYTNDDDVDVSGDDNLKVTGSAFVTPKKAEAITSVPVSNVTVVPPADGGGDN